jgi:glutamate dehydrogenase
MEEKSGHGAAEIARAFMVARDAYRLPQIWMEIESLDGEVPANTQTMMLTEINRMLERVIAWILRWVQTPGDEGGFAPNLRSNVEALDTILHQALPSDLAGILATRIAHFVEQGVPLALATRVANLIVLASVGDILAISEKYHTPINLVGGVYFSVGARFGMGQLRAMAEEIGHRGYWEKLAGMAAVEDLYAQQRDISQRIIAHGQALYQPPACPDSLTPDTLMEEWAKCHKAAVARCDSMLAEIRAAARGDLAILAVAGRQLRTLADAGKED